MTSINLMEGSLQKAIIAGADLRGANLFRVDFAKTRADGGDQPQGRERQARAHRAPEARPECSAMS